MAFIQFSNRVLLYIGAIRVGAVVSRSYLRQAINENQSHIVSTEWSLRKVETEGFMQMSLTN